MLMQKFKKMIKYLTPEEKAAMGQYDLTEEDIEYVEDPQFTAQINFETIRSIFKRNANISKSGKRGYANKFKSDKTLLQVRMTPENRDDVLNYERMIESAFGIKAIRDNDLFIVTYDTHEIEEQRKKNETNRSTS